MIQEDEKTRQRQNNLVRVRVKVWVKVRVGLGLGLSWSYRLVLVFLIGETLKSKVLHNCQSPTLMEQNTGQIFLTINTKSASELLLNVEHTCVHIRHRHPS